MTKRRLFWLALAVMLAAGLVAEPLAARAQEARVYTWAPYGLSVRVPAGWVVVESGSVVSLHPADRQVGDGQGPEMVLFTQANSGSLDAQIASYAGAITGTTGPVESETLDGYPARSFWFDQTTPDTQGKMKLIALDAQTVIGLAYTVRDGEAGAFLAALEGIYNSATFGALGVDAPVTFDPGAPDTPTYQDTAYGYTLSYPQDWTVIPQETSGEIVVRPAVSDWPEGSGPEFVIVVVEDLSNTELYGLMAQVTRDRTGDFSVPLMGMIDGYSTLLVTYTNSGENPVQNGGVLLVRLSDSAVLAIGYRAPASVYAAYGPIFDAIRQSLQFPGTMAAVTPAITSVSTASVQLPQRYLWNEAGLALYYPTGWTLEEEQKSNGTVVYAVPEQRQGADRLIQASSLPYVRPSKLTDIVDIARRQYGSPLADPVSVTVAGYSGLLFDVRDTSEQPFFYIRMLALSMTDHDITALFIFAIEESAWDGYRPLVSAFIGSIEVPDASRAARLPDRLFAPQAGEAVHGLAARIAPGLYAQQQDDPETTSFEWEESGLTIDMPAGWQTVTAGQNFDFALVSPEAYVTGTGAYVTFRDIPYVGKTTEDLNNAMQTIADQVESTIEPFETASGLAGVTVDFTDTEANTLHHLILLSYGEQGSALYVQSTAATKDEDALILSMLDTLLIDPPHSNYTAVDEAWQASLAANGTLTYGVPDAPVSMVEFLSMTCGHCGNFSVGIDRLIALEVETGRVQIEIAMLAGDPYSALATKAIYCAAAQGKGYTAYKALWQGYFEDGYDVAYTADGVSARLGDLGLDMDELNVCIEEDRYSGSAGTVRQRFTDHGLTGTPTILLGQGDDLPDVLTLPDGSVWSGTIPISILREMIDGAVEYGTPFADYFSQ